MSINYVFCCLLHYFMELNNSQLIVDYCHFNKKWLTVFSEFFAMNDLICFGFFESTIQEGIKKIDETLKNAQSREELVELSNKFEEWEDDKNFICDFKGIITNHLTTNHLHHYVTKNDYDMILIQSLIPDPKDNDEAIFYEKHIVLVESLIIYGIEKNELKFAKQQLMNLV